MTQSATKVVATCAHSYLEVQARFYLVGQDLGDTLVEAGDDLHCQLRLDTA